MPNNNKYTCSACLSRSGINYPYRIGHAQYYACSKKCEKRIRMINSGKTEPTLVKYKHNTIRIPHRMVGYRSLSI